MLHDKLILGSVGSVGSVEPLIRYWGVREGTNGDRVLTPQ